MKCLAKYLPVEDGVDYSFTEWAGMKKGDLVHDEGRNPFIVGDKKLIPAKLFAVTRYTKVGDEVFTPDLKQFGKIYLRETVDDVITIMDKGGTRSGNVYSWSDKKNAPFKILGPLSPNATWVKDGDEIKARGMKPVVVERCGAKLPSGRFNKCPECGETWKYSGTCGTPTKEETHYEVLGPCGHYH